MSFPNTLRGLRIALLALLAAMLASGCGSAPVATPLAEPREADRYIIGPGDTLNVTVWRHPDLSASVPVRPDGLITTPLVEDVRASGMTPTELARAMEEQIGRFIVDPVVTVVVTGFAGPYSRQIRVIGQAAEPRALQYRENMTVMDVMIEVGGLTDFAAGNRAKIIRHEHGRRQEIPVKLDRLINRGDIRANVPMKPGDTLLIPERFF